MPGSPERVRLDDGRTVEIRPIAPLDAEGLARGLDALSDESRYRRFLSAKQEFSRRELELLTAVDHHASEALVALEPGTEHGVGVARFVKDPADPTAAEVAIVVDDQWQSHGLGTILLDRIVVRATEEGVSRFTATVLQTNDEVLALLRALGPLEYRSVAFGVIELTVPLPVGEPCPPSLRGALRAAARGALALTGLDGTRT